MRVVISCVLLGLALSAPVPRINQSISKGLHSDNGLLVLVPTVSANARDKRDVEYEVIAIPGSILRREIRQIAGLYQEPNLAPAAPVFGGEAVLSAAGDIFETTGNNFNSIGAATATNAGNVIGFISEAGAGAGAAAAEIAGSGLSYAGQLSGALLRSLLQIPAIKARLVERLMEHTQPIATLLEDASGDLARTIEIKTSILSDVLGVIIRLISDTFSLGGRIINDIGPVIDSTIKIGGAVVESASGVGRAIGDAVGEIVEVGRKADYPAKPDLSKISLPTIPSFDLPKPIHSYHTSPAPKPDLEYGPPQDSSLLTTAQYVAGEAFLSPAQPEQFFTLVSS